MTHALTASDTLRDKIAFFIYGSFARANAFKFWIVRIYILYWSENTFAEEAVTFWLLRTVVDCFWFQHLAVAPVEDILFTGYTKANRVELVGADEIIFPSHIIGPPLNLLLYLLRRSSLQLQFLTRRSDFLRYLAIRILRRFRRDRPAARPLLLHAEHK